MHQSFWPPGPSTVYQPSISEANETLAPCTEDFDQQCCVMLRKKALPLRVHGG